MSKFSGLEGNNLPEKVGVRLKVTLPLWIFTAIYVVTELFYLVFKFMYVFIAVDQLVDVFLIPEIICQTDNQSNN